MQEADDLGMMKSFQSTDAILDDQKEIPLFEAGGSDQSLPGIALQNAITEEASHEAEQLDMPVELFSSLVGSAVDDPTPELSIRDSTRSLDLSPISDARSVDLSQLAEFIRGLNEEEYQFLLKARETVSDADPLTSSSVLPDHDFSEAFQRLKEELFLANMMQNIFNRQLVEQLELQSESDYHRDQLIGELSQLQVSHNEVNENNRQIGRAHV